MINFMMKSKIKHGCRRSRRVYVSEFTKQQCFFCFFQHYSPRLLFFFQLVSTTSENYFLLAAIYIMDLMVRVSCGYIFLLAGSWVLGILLLLLFLTL